MTHFMDSTPKARSAPKVEGASHTRFEEFKAYGGILVGLIVVLDTYQFSHGAVAAARGMVQSDVFFACLFTLLGFVLFFPTARQVMRGAAPERADTFLLKRALHIVTLYYLVVVLVWLLNSTGQAGGWPDLLEHLSFTHIYDPRYAFSLFASAWAPAALVALCLLLAALNAGLAALRRTSRRARIALLLGIPTALIVLSLLFNLMGAHSIGLIAHISPLAVLDTFAVGMLLGALLAIFPESELTRSSRLFLRVVALGVLTVLVTARVLGQWSGPFELFCASLCMALLMASTVFTAGDSHFARTLSNRFLASLGLVSYGMLLWHEPLYDQLSHQNWLLRAEPGATLLNPVLVLGASVILATASHWLIERPALQLQHSLFPRQARQEFYPQYRPAARVRPVWRSVWLGRALVVGAVALLGVLDIVTVPRPQPQTAAVPADFGERLAQLSASLGRLQPSKAAGEQPDVPRAAPASVPTEPAALPQVATQPTDHPATPGKVAPSPTQLALIRGRQLTGLFYAGHLEQIWNAFLPTVRADWNDFSAFRTFRAAGVKDFGAETKVIREKITRRGNVTYYLRTATFERGPKGGWTVVFGLDAQGRVEEFGIVAAAL